MPNKALELLQKTQAYFPPAEDPFRANTRAQRARDRDKSRRNALRDMYMDVHGDVQDNATLMGAEKNPEPTYTPPSFSVGDRIGRTLGRVLSGDPLGALDTGINYRERKTGEHQDAFRSLYDMWMQREGVRADINESRSVANRNRDTTRMTAIDRVAALPTDSSLEQIYAETSGINHDNWAKPIQNAGSLAQTLATVENQLAQARGSEPRPVHPDQAALWRAQAGYYGAGSKLRDAQTANTVGEGTVQNELAIAFKDRVHRMALIEAARAAAAEARAKARQATEYAPGRRYRVAGEEAGHWTMQAEKLERAAETMAKTTEFSEFVSVIADLQTTLGVKLVGNQNPNTLEWLVQQAGGLGGDAAQ